MHLLCTLLGVMALAASSASQTVHASYRPIGGGCAAPKSSSPVHTALSMPILGKDFQPTVGKAPPGAPAVYLLGSKRANVPFPNGCALRIGGMGAFWTQVNRNGRATCKIHLHKSATSILGKKFFGQWLIAEPKIQMGVILTSASEGTVGNEESPCCSKELLKEYTETTQVETVDLNPRLALARLWATLGGEPKPCSGPCQTGRCKFLGLTVAPQIPKDQNEKIGKAYIQLEYDKKSTVHRWYARLVVEKPGKFVIVARCKCEE